ncbi:MAG: RluA family pseudouridine synthase [Candidatus Omnitrophota bacterium]
METFKAGDENAGKRLDVFLTQALKNKYSRSFLQRAIEEGFTSINKKGAKPSHKLKSSDEIEFTAPPLKLPNTQPEDIPVKIIYEDEDVVVVDKPAGMVMHPASGNYSHTLVNALMFHCKGALSGMGAPTRPGVVHRLDKDASGVAVLAKTDHAYKELVAQFKQRTITRKYIALVKGKFALKSGKITLPIGRSSRDRKKMAVAAQGSRGLKGKDALTYYQVLTAKKEFTKLMLTLGSGRTHQIRVHTSYMGHPILGDAKYGGPKAQRLMLHAISLGFKHPASGKDLYFEAALPEEFKKIEQSA